MTTKRMTPLLLAASVFLTGAATLGVGFMAPAMAITSVDELSDVNHRHWAYDALRDLVEKYDVIEGYPSGVFRGNKAPTRYEMAAALNALVKSIGRDLARLGAEKANKSDLETLARLQEEFRQELAAINSRVSSLEDRASSMESKLDEASSRLSMLERTALHGDFSFGGLADMSGDGNKTSGNDGIRDALSTIGRLRLTMDIPVKEDSEDSLWGRGDVHARLVGAFGRVSPLAAQAGNGGSFGNYSGYSRIAGDASAFNEGPFSGTGGNTRTNLYIENVHYKQHVKSGIPLLSDFFVNDNSNEDWKTTGDLYVGVIPWRYLFDKSPYRGNEVTQFQNTAFVNTPGVAVNYNMPMVAYQWHQGLGKSASLDLTAGLGSIDGADVYDGMNATYEARLNYKTAFLGENFTKCGSVYAGGYNIWTSGNRNITNTIAGYTNRAGAAITGLGGHDGGANAIYAGMSQEWWRGIGTTVNYLLADAHNTALAFNSMQQPLGLYNATSLGGSSIAAAPRQSFSGTVTVPMSAVLPNGWRSKDALGIGYAMIDMYENGAVKGDKMERVSEAFYRFQVNDAFSVIPSVQFYRNRLGVGANDNTWVVGLRTNYVF